MLGVRDAVVQKKCLNSAKAALPQVARGVEMSAVNDGCLGSANVVPCAWPHDPGYKLVSTSDDKSIA